MLLRKKEHTLAMMICLLSCSPALGSGLEFPEQGVQSVSRGGAFSAKADDPTAAAHNPGALSKLRGTHFLYNHNLNWVWSGFTRTESVIPRNPSARAYGASEQALEPVENETPFFPLGAFVSVTHDFGVPDMTFGLSFYGPNSTGAVEFPIEGGQRYLLTKLESIMVFPGVSAAWGRDDVGFGATLQWAMLPKLRYSLVVDGTPGGRMSPYASGGDVEATLDLSDAGVPTAIVGGWWRPVPSFEIALSGRIIPIKLDARGHIVLEAIDGQTTFNDEQLTLPGNAAQLDLILPQTARLGMRYRSMEGKKELWDLELDVVYEAWSVLDAYDAKLDGVIRLFAEEPIQDVGIPKHWRDTFSLRLGGTYAASEKWKMSAGGFFEQGAAPKNYTHLDFSSSDRMGIGFGVEYAASKTIVVNLGYGRIFQPDTEVSEAFAKVFQQRPVSQCPEGPGCDGYDGVPVNAGQFTWSAQTVSLGITWRGSGAKDKPKPEPEPEPEPECHINNDCDRGYKCCSGNCQPSLSDCHADEGDIREDGGPNE